jgi:hypothetical protein
LTISDAASGAAIYYTTTGATPTTSSAKYTGPISVAATETIRAIAVVPGCTNSVAAYASYTITPRAAAPAFSPPSGTYSAAQTVALSETTAGATVYYTTNGTTPTAASTKYGGPIKVSATETIQAIAVAAGYTNNVVASATFRIGN